MNPGPPLPRDEDEEVSALLTTLHETGQRLAELTAGDVDTVADREGRTFLLQRAQEHLRHSGAGKQAAILNALPAHIALLDNQGLIISVNEAWRRFTGAHVLQGPGYEIGRNYLEICDRAQGDDASEARQVAAGIRSVLNGAVNRFSLEYPCHSPAQARWFLLTVTPLADDLPNGAVVMHLDVTAKRQTAESLRISEWRFRQMADNIREVFFLRDAKSDCMLYISAAYEEIWGRSCESLYANPASWSEAIHPEDRASTYEKNQKGMLAEKFGFEYRIVRPDGSIRWVEIRSFPVRDDAGKVVRIAGVAGDITERKRAQEVLLESEERFSGAFEFAPIGVALVSPDGRWLKVNRALCDLLGYSAAELLSRTFQEITHPEDLETDLENVRRLIAGEIHTYQMEKRYVHARGEHVTVVLNVSLVRDGQGQPLYFIAQIQDITEQKRAEMRIKRLNRVYTVLSGINTLIVRVRDRDDLFREACRIAVDQGGLRMALISIVDRSEMKIVPVASAGKDEELLTAIKDILSSSEGAPNTMVALAIREKRAVVSNDSQSDPRVLFGNKYAEAGIRSLAILPLIVANEASGVLALYAEETGFFDAEEIKLLTELAGNIAFAIDHIDKQERLDYLAYYDALTGLANRALFHERLEQSVVSAHKPGRKLALVLLDIERFKTINDTLGRPAGDALIKEVAARMAGYATDVSQLARIDADHFAIMVPEVRTGEELARLIEQCAGEVFGPPCRIGDAELRISAKFGIAMFPDDGADADTLFRNAEAALKKAKASGERYLFYTQTMNERVAENLSLENTLRQALDKEEFELHYQPKVNLANGKLTSAEALIRWNDPRTGLVAPGRFIPILEETGLIYEVGRWALRKAIEDYLRWRAAGLAAVRIAVNVSPLQLRNRAFIAEIEQAIGIDPHAAAGLELEITESLIMEDVKHSIATLQAIRAMGVTIAIDDFGTGFSSLSYLSRLPVDTLKIDRSFVIGMTAGPQGLALVSTIIGLAHALKLKVVAEGVETEEQARLLRLLNCDEMQGYLFSKPLPVEIFEARYLTPPALR